MVQEISDPVIQSTSFHCSLLTYILDEMVFIRGALEFSEYDYTWGRPIFLNHIDQVMNLYEFDQDSVQITVNDYAEKQNLIPSLHHKLSLFFQWVQIRNRVLQELAKSYLKVWAKDPKQASKMIRFLRFLARDQNSRREMNFMSGFQILLAPEEDIDRNIPFLLMQQGALPALYMAFNILGTQSLSLPYRENYFAHLVTKFPRKEELARYLLYAPQFNKQKIAELLKQRDTDGKTPKDLAKEKGLAQLAEMFRLFLLETGSDTECEFA